MAASAPPSALLPQPSRLTLTLTLALAPRTPHPHSHRNQAWGIGFFLGPLIGGLLSRPADTAPFLRATIFDASPYLPHLPEPEALYPTYNRVPTLAPCRAQTF